MKMTFTVLCANSCPAGYFVHSNIQNQIKSDEFSDSIHAESKQPNKRYSKTSFIQQGIRSAANMTAGATAVELTRLYYQT